jgi:hypothetical protein
MLDIPEDLFYSEILMRLPVKSFLRFRCVCKGWCFAISNRMLIESDRQHSQSKLHLFRLPPLRHFGITISSHDLIVLIYNDGHKLSNPAMQDIVYLPHPPSLDV